MSGRVAPRICGAYVASFVIDVIHAHLRLGSRFLSSPALHLSLGDIRKFSLAGYMKMSGCIS